MTKKTMVAELQAIRAQAEESVTKIGRLADELYAETQRLRKGVESHAAKRVELLKKELESRSLTWCTRCFQATNEEEAELLLVEGREQYSCGENNSCYAFRDFSKFLRACTSCRERCADMHGQPGQFSGQANDRSSFYAFRVQKRDDGHYARKFGKWVKLDDKLCKLDEPSEKLVEGLAQGWGLPPKIDLDRQNKLVVQGETTAAVR